METLSQIIHPPFQIVQRAVANHLAFAISHFPSETDSDDEPPVHISEDSDVIAIDGVLGNYDPDTQKITIFKQGIERVAILLDCRPADLKYVVRLHEWAHALLHIGLQEGQRLDITQDESLWPECLVHATTWFRDLEPCLHERLAQLLTHHGLDSLQTQATLPEARTAIERITGVFERLTRRAPPDYQIHHYSGVPRSRIVSSIKLLKDRNLIGADAWQTVVTW